MVFISNAIAISLFDLNSFLHFVEGNVLFIALSFLIRIPQAIGGAAIITASVTLVTLQFSDSVATTFVRFNTHNYCKLPQ